MTLSELLAIPAVAALGLLWRRLFWFLCRCAGEVIAANEGRVVDAAGAFAIGKMKVMQTAANMLLLRLQQIEWDEIGRGFAAGFAVWRVHAYEAWKGLWRDVSGKALRQWLRLRQQIRADAEAAAVRIRVAHEQFHEARERRRLLAEAVNASGTPWHSEPVDNTHAAYRFEFDRIMAAPTTTEKDLLALPSYMKGLAAYGDHPQAAWAQALQVLNEPMPDPPPQVQALLSPTVFPARLQMLAVAGAAFAVLTLGLYVQTKRVWALKDDVREMKAQTQVLTRSRDAYATSLAQRDARIENSTKICLSEIETARQSALKAEQQAARERARRIHEQRKTLDGGGAVPLSDILRQLPPDAGSPDAPSGAVDPGSP